MPIYATSTFTQEAPGRHKGYEYSRSGNPTRDGPRDLPGGPRGRRTGAWPSPPVWPPPPPCSRRLRPGDEVAAAADLYGGTFRLLERVFKPWGLVPRYTEDASPEGFAAIISPATKLVWIETPTNPLLQIIDIAAIAALAHASGAMLAVDNTFASPYLQRPIEHGADLVVHSTTKYLGGHSDVIGGAVIGRRGAARADRVLPECRRRRARPVRLLARAPRHQDAGRADGAPLRQRPRARRSGWPSSPRSLAFTIPAWPDHPNHAVARRQMRDFGGMISIRLKGGADAAQRLLTRTRLFSLAESLGGVESLIGHPATMTHASIPPRSARPAASTTASSA